MAKKDDEKQELLIKENHGKISIVEIEDQMKDSYLAYSMSVIVGRALPDVRDGLKPVHRRILHAMNERAWRHDRPYVKCAKIVGEVIGNFHPHGDAAVYETMVRMAQDFSMNVPLIDGQGNFGSVDGDPAAAYRYTEARLEKVAEELLKDIDKETVDLVDNFDGTRREPTVLPASFPNLLVNGSSGIAVGMATNIPPHNLHEVIDACTALIDEPELSSKALIKYVKGPDFPTGGIIIGTEGIHKAFLTGRGSITVRAKLEIEEDKKGKEYIIVSEIPYQVNKAQLIAKIADLVNSKVIEGIGELRDESDRTGMRIVIGIKRDASSNIILNLLYKHTALQSSFGIIQLALVNNEPKVLDLKGILSNYILHRKEVVYKRTQYELRKAEERAHILEGLKIALDNIDEVIAIIRGSKTVDEADNKLQKRFKLSERQSKAILDMRLQRLTSLEIKKIEEELRELHKLIAELKSILASDKKVLGIVKKELIDIKEKYPSKRKTEITITGEVSTDFDLTDLIADEDVMVSITNDGFIRRLPLDSFKKQRRGGKGVSGMSSSKKEDFVKLMKITAMHDTMLLFSNKGKVFAMKTHEVPQASKTTRGKSLKGLINLATGENITAICPVEDFDAEKYMCMATKQGILKKITVSEFKNVKKNGIIAIGLKKEDELVNVVECTTNDDIVIGSKQGSLLRTNLSKMRPMGRGAAGIIGMRLEEDDQIIGVDTVKPESSLFVISEKGFGKRVEYKNFQTKGRGGKGMTFLKPSDKNGNAAAISSVFDDDELIIMSKEGMTIRLIAKDIPLQGRPAVGVRILHTKDNDTVSDFAIVNEEMPEE